MVTTDIFVSHGSKSAGRTRIPASKPRTKHIPNYTSEIIACQYIAIVDHKKDATSYNSLLTSLRTMP